MNKGWWVVVLAVICAAPAQAQQITQQQLQQQRTLIHPDTEAAEKGAVISKKAFMENFESYYNDLDTNHDGVVSQEELARAYGKGPPVPAKEAAGVPNPSGAPVAGQADAPAGVQPVAAPVGIPPVNADQLLKK